VKSLLIVLLCHSILAGRAFAEDGPPNPYKIFAEEQPKVYRIPITQSSLAQGDKVPDLSQRPRALQPGSIPARVRYSFAADSTMAEAALLLTNHFCSSAHDEALLFGKTLVVHPGAWSNLKQADSVGKKSATQWGFLVWDGNAQQKLAGFVLRDGEELKQAEALIRQNVQNAGGATVRALSSAEMTKWWIFIGFDIQEPTLVLETKDKKQRYIFGFVGRKVVVVDELNSLPDPQNIQGP
jgi:hypothetical protein